MKTTRFIQKTILVVSLIFIPFSVSTAQEMKMQDNQKESIVREGKFDVQKIDKNADGKLYQCMMDSDWNVISDEAVRCPVCEMELTESPIKVVKERVMKFGVQETKNMNKDMDMQKMKGHMMHKDSVKHKMESDSSMQCMHNKKASNK
jgi:hypothetical protein